MLKKRSRLKPWLITSTIFRRLSRRGTQSMSKKEEAETERFHAVLFKEDLEYIRQNYGPGSAHSSIGVSKVIRIVVNQRVRGLKARAAGALDGLAEKEKKS